VFKAKAVLKATLRQAQGRAFVPADLLCPQAEKSAVVETKHGYALKLQFLIADPPPRKMLI